MTNSIFRQDDPPGPAARSSIGVLNRRHLLFAGGTASVIGLAFFWRHLDQADPVSSDIKVVHAPGVAIKAAPGPVPAQVSSLGDAAPDLANLSLIELQLLMRKRQNNSVAAARISRDLQTSFARLGMNISVGDVLVTGSLCEINGFVAMPNPADQDSIVDRLSRGVLLSAIEASRLRDPTEVSVNKEGDRTLSFTFHARIQ